ncbi:MAG: anaerobic ribonucleoside-triphosphate reductase activating protein [Roseburia sp.]|nr:anaerobic ribonucleoside-triphosphate reductase activating protein [Roseburia sp.]MCM1097037.1 anaerobic ribonucleoside-triphosphate reductase activating protein [Ruminococcus flavefaciens]
MNYATIKKTDVANGPGIRVSLFVSGCTHFCKSCFNSEAWDFAYGQEFTEETEKEILKALEPSYIRGFSVLGGEPMEPENRETVCRLLERIRSVWPGKDIWCYTGYDYEKDLLRWEREERERAEAAGKGDGGELLTGTQVTEGRPGTVGRLLSLIDVLVDGEFVEEQKNLRLPFRGSENQRLIDVRKSRLEGRVVCL